MKATNTHQSSSWSPVWVVAQFIESSDDIEKGGKSALSDTFVVVVQQLHELERARFNIGQEVCLGRQGKGAHCIRSNLFLDGNSTVDFIEFIKINGLDNLRCVDFLADGDRGARRGSSAKGRSRCRDIYYTDRNEQAAASL